MHSLTCFRLITSCVHVRSLALVMQSHSGFIPLLRAGFGACNALVCMCGCKLLGALAHNTRTCYHVVCTQSDLLQNDCKWICHLHIASVAALRAATETDAQSPALDSAHGSQRLSALALSAGSQRWLSAHGLSAWLQRVSLSAGSHRVALMMMGKRRQEDKQ
jgi:hypothetical protein